MPSPKKRIIDEHLASGSIIYWSRRQDPYVPVMCGQCKRERIIRSNNTTRSADVIRQAIQRLKTFLGEED